MPVGSVVFTPGTPYVPCPVPALDLSDMVVPDDEWVARVALSLAGAASSLVEPLLLVLAGRQARLAPSLGFSQRAARRAIAGYVLVDPVLPAATTSDWPDAPVTVIITPQADDDVRSSALAARLRGWQIVSGEFPAAMLDLLSRP